jgi:hypothetical protein
MQVHVQKSQTSATDEREAVEQATAASVAAQSQSMFAGLPLPVDQGRWEMLLSNLETRALALQRQEGLRAIASLCQGLHRFLQPSSSPTSIWRLSCPALANSRQEGEFLDKALRDDTRRASWRRISAPSPAFNCAQLFRRIVDGGSCSLGLR